VSELLHRALYALPDVTLAVDGRSLRIVDVNRAGDAFGYSRAELTALALDALLDSPRAEIASCVAAADRILLATRVRRKDGTSAAATVRASTSAAAAVMPCVLVVVREAALQVAEPGVIEDACVALRSALASLERLVPAAPTAPELSLAEYASLQVEREMGRDPLDKIDGRYGLTPPLRAELDRAWRAKLDREPALRQELARLVAQYREWFQSNRREGGPRKPPPDGTVSAVDMDFSAAGALPFRPPEVPDLSVEQYAALTVEMDASPHAHGQVLELYGITSEATWRACEAHWTEMLNADPMLRKRWMRLVADLRGKLVRSAPPR
jgi:hypothetical protein